MYPTSDPFAAAKSIADKLDAFAAAQQENERLKDALVSALVGGRNDTMRALRLALDGFVACMAAESDERGPVMDRDIFVAVRVRHQDLADFVRLFRDMPL